MADLYYRCVLAVELRRVFIGRAQSEATMHVRSGVFLFCQGNQGRHISFRADAGPEEGSIEGLEPREIGCPHRHPYPEEAWHGQT